LPTIPYLNPFMSNQPHEKLLAQLNWRYAVKQFDPAQKISDPVWKSLEAALILTPSSYGLQPWKFVVVADPETRVQLRAASWNQAQITDSSHLVVFAIPKVVDEAYVHRHLDRVAEVRQSPRDALKGLGDRIIGDLVKGPRQAEIKAWATRQAYIALGSFITSAAVVDVDTCALEGIQAEKYDEILGLSPLGFNTVVAAAAGYRHPEDKYGRLAKVRFSPEDTILHR
jgi:nitroreductase